MIQSGIRELFARDPPPSRRPPAVSRLLRETGEVASLSPQTPPGERSATGSPRGAARPRRAGEPRGGDGGFAEGREAAWGGKEPARRLGREAAGGNPSAGGVAPLTPCTRELPQACAYLAWVIAVVAVDRGEKISPRDEFISNSCNIIFPLY